MINRAKHFDKSIFVLAEQNGGKLLSISLELLGEGKRLAREIEAKVICVLLGENIRGLCRELGHSGLDQSMRPRSNEP